MSFDLQRARHDTPGCTNVLHLNNAGSSLMPSSVLQAVTSHLQMEAHIGGYEAASRASEAIDHVYDAIAKLIGCARDEVAYVECATRAWDMAFYSVKLGHGDRILTTVTEYGSNYISFLQRARKTGATIEVIPNDAHGQISLNALRNKIDERVKLIAMTHVPTNGGLVNPVEAVGKIANEAGILFLLDACQAVGQMPINVDQIGCDMLSATGRKYLRGPRGTGFLYVRRQILDQLEPPFLDMHAANWIASDRYEVSSGALRFETWETNYAGKIGLGVAIDYALQWGLDTIWLRIQSLAQQLRMQLNRLPGVTTNDLGAAQCGIVTFTIKRIPPESIQYILSQEKINVSVTTLSSTLLDMKARGLTSLVRASVHYYNSEEEITTFCNRVAAMLW